MQLVVNSTGPGKFGNSCNDLQYSSTSDSLVQSRIMIRVSVIIPAHNEAAVIRRTLDSLVEEFPFTDWEVIVVCNGCSDKTAQIVSEYKCVKLIETPTASKIHALNLGDADARGMIRVYVDADVSITPGDLRLLVERLEHSELLAVSPSFKMHLENCSWFVRAYYRVWMMMPFIRQGFMGAGVYALSEQGRSRFENFPDVISDDGFVRGNFSLAECGRVEEAFSEVWAPRTISGLIKIKTRSRLGSYQLLNMFSSMRSEHVKSKSDIFRRFVGHPQFWPELIVYILVNLICKARAKRLLKRMDSYLWETEDTSRT